MKKNRGEIVLGIIIGILTLVSLFFYNQSKTITTISNIDYTEEGKLNYKVYLNENSYYKEEFLGEGMQYISSIINNITVNYKYNIDYDTDKKFIVNRRVLANIKITDSEDNNKVIYTKQEELLNDKYNDSKVIDLSDELKIDYSKYNHLTNEFKTNYGINADCNLIIDYIVDYKSTDKDISQSKTMTMTIPLSKQMIVINKSNDINESSSYEGETKDSFVNKLMFALAVLFASIVLILVIILILIVRKRIQKESKYDRYISKLLKEYDTYITESSETRIDGAKNLIKTTSFKELLDVRNNLDRPIIYNKVNNDTSRFIIMSDEVYVFEVNRRDME